ncbi:MAG TPA: DNA repair protein RecN [Candidatus Rubrimentiphilum sp.]|nr:DNA repair protein RecN [Candidatus Rubrimentiphilum sp.]
MLRRLRIADYELIADAEIDFASGATMFTGETGSGKTMVLGAVAFVLGERAGADVVRRGSGKAAVTLEFDPDKSLREKLCADGFEFDPDEDATISRELSESGKSTLRLNGRPTTAGYVRDLAAELVDIVGQHEAQRLLAPAYHLELLDRFGGEPLLRVRESVTALHARAGKLAGDLRDLNEGERRAQERHAFAKYALDEIESTAPAAGEDDRLNERRRFLDNVERIALALRGAHDALAGDEASASSALGAAGASLQQLRGLGEGLTEMAQSASALQSEVNELAVRISRELDATEFQPAELETINARLEALDTLKRKYGGSIDAVLAAADEFRTDVDLFSNVGERKAQLERDLTAAQSELKKATAELSKLRNSAADKLRKAVEKELQDLALPSGRFGVQFEALGDIASTGAERAEFLFAANKGEEERPLARVASGGELSRVLLALIVVLAGKRGKTALVFDEIDLGIGGATATAVGVRLGRLAREAQVMCVTHLAQIAAWADEHYVLEKTESRSATTISVRRVDKDADRTGEIARMLSGETHDAALKHARTLLRQTTERRSLIA